MSIRDGGKYTSSLSVAPTGRIIDLDVEVNIIHNWDQDVTATLIAPDGTRIELFSGVGSSGDNFTNTVLDDEALTPITSGTAPFTGRFLPAGDLTAVEGTDLTGTWKLEVVDAKFGGKGTLVDWSIIARYSTAPTHPQAIVDSDFRVGHDRERAGQATFTVVLDNWPNTNVIIPISSSDSTEGTVAPASLTFTPEQLEDAANGHRHGGG